MFEHIIRVAALSIGLFLSCRVGAQCSPGGDWALWEVYSNADGSVQFVQLTAQRLPPSPLTTLIASSGTTENAFTFPSGVESRVIRGFPVLVATRGFTDLTAITPDFVLPSGFLPLRNGSVRLANMPWCTGPVQYDTLPTDGVNAYYPDAFGETGVYVDAAIATNTAGAKYAFTQSTVPGAIGPGFTGAWYDPAQSGHGLFVEVLSDNRFLAWWFAFNPAGSGQAWFGGVGTYSGTTATIADVYETTGGRWIPNFDAARVGNNRWGSLTFTFTDCNHGRVDFNSVAGYGSGNMNLTRLTQPVGLSCP